MMRLMAQRVFDADESTLSERQVLSSTTRPAKIEKRQITRNRTSYSCQNCRKRKIKCDKVHPECGACLRNNDKCLYGKGEIGTTDSRHASNAPDGVNGQIRPDSLDSTSQSRGYRSVSQKALRSSEADQLSALEGQLARLTSMVENLRGNGSLLAGEGLQTPKNSQSPSSDHINAGNDGFTPHLDMMADRDDGALNRPMSELEISKQKTQPEITKTFFLETLSEEIDQLQTLFRGSFDHGPAPRQNQDSSSCFDDPQSDLAQPEVGIPGPIGFHAAAYGNNRAKGVTACQICQQASADKSILLLGPSSPRKDAMPKVDLTNGVPSEEQSNALFRAYVTSIHPILPFMPLRRILLKHSAFWDWKRQYDHDPKSVTESPDIVFLPVLNVIWYAGVIAMSTKGVDSWFPGLSRAELAAHYHDQVIRYMGFLSFPGRVKYPLIGAMVILEFLPTTEQDPLQSSSYLNLLVRLGQSTGINRENKLADGAFYETEMRRRLWAHILKLDTALCVSSGMPSSVDDAVNDSLAISEVKEYVIGTEAETQYQSDVKRDEQKMGIVDDPYGTTRSIVSVYHLVSKASSTVDRTIRKILRSHLSPDKLTKETLIEMNAVIGETEQFVKNIISSIPVKGMPELGFEPEVGNALVFDCDPILGTPIEEGELSGFLGVDDSDQPSNLAKYHRQKLVAFHKWARITLSLLCDKMHCIAYAPFLKNARSKSWITGRQCALHHSSSYLRKFVSLGRDPLLAPFRWSWPAMHHPLQAAIIILVDVYERPFSVEAPRNRSWIDKVFELADPDTGIVGGLDGPSTQRPLHEGGADAWDQLRGLRSSAWRKAGLDPGVLWSEEDQMLVGVAKPLTEDQRALQSMREDSMYDKSGYELSKKSGLLKSLMNLGSEEVKTIDRAQILEYALSDQAEEVFAAIKPPSNRTVKLEGQRRMPFPIPSRMAQKCMRVERALDPSSAPPTISDTVTIMIEDLITKIKEHADKHSLLIEEDPCPTSTHTDNLQDKKVISELENMMTPGVTPATRRSSDPTKIAFNGIIPNGLQIDYSTLQAPQPETYTPQATPIAGVDASMSDTPDSFDWSIWDSVFSQYGGFTDLMEDIHWEEPGHA